MQTLKENIDSFLEYCRLDRNFSRHTVKAYRLDLESLARFLEEHGLHKDSCKLTPNVLRGYARTLFEWKPRTQRRKLAVVKSFCSYMEREGIVESNPARNIRLDIRMERLLPRTVSGSTIESLLRHLHQKRDHALNSKHSRIPIRDVALFELLFASGMRVSEVADLRVGSIDLERGTIIVRGKGSKERLIPICEREVLSAIRGYAQLFCQTDDPREFFFRNRSGSRLSEQSIRLSLRRHAKAAGLEKITPHVLRHTVATMLLEQGVDIRFIQTFLGHSSIVTTTIYVHVNERSQREVLQSRHPRRFLHVVGRVTEPPPNVG
jgi:integrase/recombinase XerD